MLEDRHSFRRDLKGRSTGKHMAARIQASCDKVRQRTSNCPLVSCPPELPIANHQQALIELIQNHQVVIVCGETGSGKSTQLPKICLQAGFGFKGRIAHTQPRRIATRSIAERLSEEMKSPLGQAVGYKVRFAEQISDQNYIRVLTDGMLLAECEKSRFLDQYEVIIIDEAHERSLNIDFLLGILKPLLQKRPELKLLVTSATLDSDKFSQHFNDAPTIHIEGRSYPVEVRYRENLPENGTKKTPELPEQVHSAIEELQLEAPGDVLVFLPGEREIRECHEYLQRKVKSGTDILPLYARLAPADQHRIFQPAKRARIVLSTNVAETSLTVPGIKYVVDSGLARVSRYSATRKIQRLPVEKIAQSAADQRAGRCGRVSDGICIRLYEEEDYLQRAQYTDAEILRTSLADVILRMLSMRLGQPDDFPFIDPPERRQINDGIRHLKELDAVDEHQRITPLGKKLARLPVDPRIGRMLLAAAQLDCLREVMVIAAALSVPDPRQVPADQQQKARQHHREMVTSDSDFIGYLEIWQAFRQQQQEQSKRKAFRWCEDNFLSVYRMREWGSLQASLLQLLKQQKLRFNKKKANEEVIHRALLTGLLSNVAQLDKVSSDQNSVKGSPKKTRKGVTYQGTFGKHLKIFPGSACKGQGGKWIMCAELVETSDLYARTVAPVKVEWIEAAGQHLLQYAYSDPSWQSKQERVVAKRRATLYGLSIYHGRSCDFGKVDPVECRKVFIRSALVDGLLESKLAFYQQNQRAIDEVDRLQNKLRRRDLLLDEEKIYDFYDERIPAHIFAASDLRKWHRQLDDSEQKSLCMSVNELMNYPVDRDLQVAFPDKVQQDDISVPLQYAFEPGKDVDGITAEITLPLLNQLNAGVFDRLVPGMLKDKLVALVKSLPKAKRRHYVPIPDTVDRIFQQVASDTYALPISLANALNSVKDVAVSGADFQLHKLDEFHLMKLRLLDDRNHTLAISTGLEDLRNEYGDLAHKSFVAKGTTRLERSDIRKWDFDTLPDRIRVRVNEFETDAFPALVDYEDSVSIEVFDTESEAAIAHTEGVRRLLMLEIPDHRRLMKKPLPEWQGITLMYAAIGQVDDLQQAMLHKAQDLVFFYDQPVVRTKEAFQALITRRSGELPAMLIRIAGQVKQALARYREVMAVRLSSDHDFPVALLRDVDEQLEWLIYDGFIEDVSAEWIEHIPRYLQGVLIRLQQAGLDVLEDQRRQQQVEPYWQHFLSLDLPYSEDLEQYRWMIEEYRVSVFAQSLKTSRTVSPKRLDRLRQKLDKQTRLANG